jgi:ferredoxin
MLIKEDTCIGCGQCFFYCPVEAIYPGSRQTPKGQVRRSGPSTWTDAWNAAPVSVRKSARWTPFISNRWNGPGPFALLSRVP